EVGAYVVGVEVVPSPLVVAGVVGVVRGRDLVDQGLEANYPAALVRALGEFVPALGIAQLVALALAVLCFRRQVAYGGVGWGRVVWPLLGLVLGLPGWVGYRLGRSWPVREECPACGARVARDRGECGRCEAEFPPAARKGTEVFA